MSQRPWFTKTEYKIFQVIRELKAATARDIKERLPKVSLMTIGLCLLDMVYKGILERYKEKRYFRIRDVYVYELSKEMKEN